MSKEKPESIEYNEATQKLFLEFMISNQDDFVRCQNIINPNFWDAKFRPTCRYIKNYADTYKVLPTPEQINAETGIDLNKHDTIEISHHSAWFLETIESFCRHKAMEALVMDGPDLIDQGKYAELERRSKENMLISLQKDMGTSYFNDPLARLTNMKNRKNQISTGWAAIDKKLYGGFERGQLNIWAGGPGSGKSLFLQNYALNMVVAGLDVMYITLELSEDLVSLRFDAMISEISTREIFKNLDEVAMRVAMTHKKNNWGNLSVKKFPEAGTNANDIRAFLKEYEILNKKRPDVLVVDYLDLLHPNSGKVSPSDLFIKDKYTSEELRALSSEWNLLTVTASQLNRAAVQEQSFDHSHIAGGISKINTADNVMAIFTNDSMKEQGKYQIQFLKTRSSSGVGARIELKFNKETLRISDADGEEYIPTESEMKSSSGLSQRIEKAKLANNPVVAENERTITKTIEQETVKPIVSASTNLRDIINKVKKKP